MGKSIIKNAGKGKLTEKIPRRVRRTWVSKLRKTQVYKYCYFSYWHLLLSPKKTLTDTGKKNLYFAARPNPGAGIGHQMANWIAGYWFARQLDLKFAHIPFSSPQWEEFLGFYQNEKTVKELKCEGYRIIRLQLFDEYDSSEWNRIEQIVSSYAGQKVIFLAEQDQFYHDQFGVMKQIQDKFYTAPAREKEHLIFDKSCYNIAIHVRRGDIMESMSESTAMRFQANGYFLQALKTALEYIKEKDKIQIYLFSQGKEEDFPEFAGIENLHFCLSMGARESFLHMVYADALITSKSSFSYKPALLNRGIKFCPSDFWHGYPKANDWILLDKNGMRIQK